MRRNRDLPQITRQRRLTDSVVCRRCARYRNRLVLPSRAPSFPRLKVIAPRCDQPANKQTLQPVCPPARICTTTKPAGRARPIAGNGSLISAYHPRAIPPRGESGRVAPHLPPSGPPEWSHCVASWTSRRRPNSYPPAARSCLPARRSDGENERETRPLWTNAETKAALVYLVLRWSLQSARSCHGQVSRSCGRENIWRRAVLFVGLDLSDDGHSCFPSLNFSHSVVQPDPLIHRRWDGNKLCERLGERPGHADEGTGGGGVGWCLTRIVLEGIPTRPRVQSLTAGVLTHSPWPSYCCCQTIIPPTISRRLWARLLMDRLTKQRNTREQPNRVDSRLDKHLKKMAALETSAAGIFNTAPAKRPIMLASGAWQRLVLCGEPAWQHEQRGKLRSLELAPVAGKLGARA